MATIFPLNHTIPLQENSSATGTNQFTWVGGPGTFSAEATWSSGTVTLQAMSNAGTWMAVGVDTTMTANGVAGFILPKGTQIRAAITTATAVFAYANTIP
jgi:hypothetical protein